MNLDDLKVEWNREVRHAGPALDARLEGLKRQVVGLRHGVRFGSIWLVLTFLGVSALEAFAQFVSLDGTGWMSKLGAVTWVLFTVWLIVVLHRSVRVTRSDDWTLRSRLEIEIERVQKHKDTWTNAGSWYFVPMMAAVVLSALGGNHDRTGSYAPGLTGWALLVAYAAVFALVYWYCRWEIRRTLDPLLSGLRGLHAELVGSETGSP